MINKENLIKSFKYKHGGYYVNFEYSEESIEKWIIYHPKSNKQLKGSNVVSFKKTFDLIVKKETTSTFESYHQSKIFNFPNLSLVMLYLKSVFLKINKRINNFKEWLEIKKEYLIYYQKNIFNDKKLHQYENFYYAMSFEDGYVALMFLFKGRQVIFRCNRKMSSFKLEKRETILLETGYIQKNLLPGGLLNECVVAAKYNEYFNEFSKRLELAFYANKLKQVCFLYKSSVKSNFEFLTKGNGECFLKITNASASKDKIVLFKPYFTFVYRDFKKNNKIMPLNKINEVKGVFYLTWNEAMFLKSVGVKLKGDKTCKHFKVNVVDNKKRLFSPYFNTLASFFWKSFKNYYGKGNFRKDFGDAKSNVITKKQLEIIDKSFLPELKSFNQNFNYFKAKNNYKNNYFKENIMVIDINNAYANEFSKSLPYGKAILKKDNTTNLMGFVKVKIFSFKLKDKDTLPFFEKDETRYECEKGLRDKNFNESLYGKYLSEWKKEWGYFYFAASEEYFNFICKYYNVKYKKKTIFYFETKPFALNFINVLKKFKKTLIYQSEKNILKLLLVSLYGKFSRQPYVVNDYEFFKDDKKTIKYLTGLSSEVVGLDRIKGEKVFSYDTWDIASIKLLQEIGKSSENLKISYTNLKPLDKNNNYYLTSYKENLNDKWFPPRFVGSVIKSRVKMKMIETINKIGKKNVMFYNTDNIYFLLNAKTSLVLNKLNISQNKIGAFKYVALIDKMFILNMNTYIYKIRSEFKNGKWKGRNYYKPIVSGVSDIKEKLLNEKEGWGAFKPGKTLKNAKIQIRKKNHGFYYDIQNYTFPSFKKNGKIKNNKKGK